jgi:membrane protease YdiL (CAAX protease family)
MQKPRFNIFHAVAAAALVLSIPFGKGLSVFWRQFVHGHETPLTAQMIRSGLVAGGMSMGAIALVLFISTLFSERRHDAGERPDLKKAARLVFRMAPAVIVAALGLQLLTAKSIEWIWGIQAADQELVKFFHSPSCSAGLRTHIILSILIQAPIVEECLFRGIMFRGFAHLLPVPASMAISGLVFAVVHVNAASFFGVWFLGVAFAWTYARTHTLLAPILLHIIFNAFNLAVLLMFPELVV